MDGRAFLDSARHLLAAPSEANWRSAAWPVYLALLHEAKAALERWGFPLSVSDDIHSFVPGRFGSTANYELIRVEVGVKQLADFAQEAGCALASPGKFADKWEVSHMLAMAGVLIQLLADIDSDPTQRAAATADIRARYP